MPVQDLIYYFNLGLSFAKEGKYELAIDNYEKAINIKQDCIEAYFNLANVYLCEGEKEKAIECYERTLKLNPNLIVAYKSLGNIHFQLNNMNLAVDNFKKALLLDSYSLDLEYLFNNMKIDTQEDSLLFCKATIALCNEKLALADRYCRQKLDYNPQTVWALLLLAIISKKVNLPDFARDYIEKSSDILEYKTIDKLDDTRLEDNKPVKDSQRFLLIKAWGFGFWSDIDHVLGQLLIAEITSRIPVVYWGDNSLYRSNDNENAFESYFLPVSEYKINDLIKDNYSFYPGKWSISNLYQNNVQKWQGNESRVDAIYTLNRSENVVVSDFYSGINDIVNWIKPNQPLYGKKSSEIYRYLVKKYLRLRNDIVSEIENFFQQNMENKHILAVHIRGSDKIKEMNNLHEANELYYDSINKYLNHYPDSYIFLLTDDEKILCDFKALYRQKLIYTDCFRTSNNTGIHYQKHSNKRRVGIEIIKDTYLAAKCNYFIGNGRSNVSTTILHLKDWQDNYALIGENFLYERNFFIHLRQ